MTVKGWTAALSGYLLAFAALVAATSPVAHAQQAAAAGGPPAGQSRHGVGLGFGRVMLAGDMATTYDAGIGLHLLYTFESGPTYGLLVMVQSSSHGSTLAGARDTDSLSMKIVNPNLRINVISSGSMTFSAFGGLGLAKISQNYRGYEAGVTTLGLTGGAQVMIDIDPHFRFGPGLFYTKFFGATDATAVGGPPTPEGSVQGPGVGIAGQSYNLFFDLMYLF